MQGIHNAPRRQQQVQTQRSLDGRLPENVFKAENGHRRLSEGNYNVKRKGKSVGSLSPHKKKTLTAFLSLSAHTMKSQEHLSAKVKNTRNLQITREKKLGFSLTSSEENTAFKYRILPKMYKVPMGLQNTPHHLAMQTTHNQLSRWKNWKCRSFQVMWENPQFSKLISSIWLSQIEQAWCHHPSERRLTRKAIGVN